MAEPRFRVGDQWIDLLDPQFQLLPSAPEPGAYIVQFREPLRQAHRKLLLASGVQEYSDPMDRQTLSVRMTAGQTAALRAQPEVYAAVWFRPEWKRKLPANGGEPDLTLNVTTFPGHEQAVADLLRSQLSATGVEIDEGLVCAARCDRTRLNLLAASERVLRLSQSPPPVAEGYRASLVVKARKKGLLGRVSPIIKGLTGVGQKVAILDTGLDNGARDPLLPDFGPVQFDGSGFSAPSDKDPMADLVGHGTAVAGIVAGKVKNLGIAPDASLVIQFRDGGEGKFSAAAMRDRFVSAAKLKATVHNNSWGNPRSYTDDDGDEVTNEEYDEYCRKADRVAGLLPYFTIVKSAGNIGEKGLTSPGAAKNVITVGACENAVGDFLDVDGWKGVSRGFNVPSPLLSPDRIHSTSSRGPTGDGRVKPDVVAPGVCLIAPVSRAIPGARRANALKEGQVPKDLRYAYWSGTSLATPVVSGCLALLRQWLQTMAPQRVENPTSALLKALLINGADRVENESWMSPRAGWGRVNLANIVKPHKRKVWYETGEPALAEGEMAEYQFEVTGTAPFKVTLVWLDPVGDDLVNDLDLRVIAPGDIVYVGNDFPSPGYYSAKRDLLYSRVDTANNVECVVIDLVNPKDGSPLNTGVYRVQVRCRRLGGNPLKQSFALVLSGPPGLTKLGDMTVKPIPAPNATGG